MLGVPQQGAPDGTCINEAEAQAIGVTGCSLPETKNDV